MNIQSKRRDTLRRVIDTFGSSEEWDFLLLHKTDMQGDGKILLMGTMWHTVIISRRAQQRSW